MRSGGVGRIIALALAGGSLVNLVWEVAQSALYHHDGSSGMVPPLASCALAALLDGVAITAIYVALALLWRDPAWPSKPRFARAFAVVVIGGGGAILVETLALELGWWSYTSEMPVLPLVRVGLTPVVQFMLLPAVVLFGLSGRHWRKGRQIARKHLAGDESQDARDVARRAERGRAASWGV